MKFVKTTAVIAALALPGTTAIAGGMADPVMPPVEVIDDTTASSSANLIVPLIIIALIAAAASSN